MKQVHIKIGGAHQQEKIKTMAEENGIPLICICGVCTVREDDASELRRLIMKVVLESSAALQEIKQKVNGEMFLINIAAASCFSRTEVVETRLRQEE